MRTFSATEAVLVSEFDGQKTAWCPFCDIVAVLGDASGYPITKEFLKKMNEELF